MPKSSSLIDTRVIYCGSSDAIREISQCFQREHISIVPLTVREILDETIAHRLV